MRTQPRTEVEILRGRVSRLLSRVRELERQLAEMRDAYVWEHGKAV